MLAILEGRSIPIEEQRRDTPKDLALIISKAMANEPSRRYTTALALANDLQRFLDGYSVQARPHTLAYRTSVWMRRHRAVASAAVLSLMVLGAAIAWGIRSALSRDP